MVVNQRVGDSLRAVPTLLFSVVVAGCGAGLVRMLDMTPLTCLTIVPGAQPFVDLVGVVGVGLLSYGIVFSQAATLFDRIGNVSAAVVIISRSPALTGLCAAGNAFDDRVAHAAKTWAYVGGLVGTIVVGLVAGLGATLLFAPASSLDEASARLSRVAMRIAHALRMTVRALSRVQDASQPPERLSIASPTFAPPSLGGDARGSGSPGDGLRSPTMVVPAASRAQVLQRAPAAAPSPLRLSPNGSSGSYDRKLAAADLDPATDSHGRATGAGHAGRAVSGPPAERVVVRSSRASTSSPECSEGGDTVEQHPVAIRTTVAGARSGDIGRHSSARAALPEQHAGPRRRLQADRQPLRLHRSDSASEVRSSASLPAFVGEPTGKRGRPGRHVGATSSGLRAGAPQRARGRSLAAAPSAPALEQHRRPGSGRSHAETEGTGWPGVAAREPPVARRRSASGGASASLAPTRAAGAGPASEARSWARPGSEGGPGARPRGAESVDGARRRPRLSRPRHARHASHVATGGDIRELVGLSAPEASPAAVAGARPALPPRPSSPEGPGHRRPGSRHPSGATFEAGPASLRVPNIAAATLAALDSAEQELVLLHAALQAAELEARWLSAPSRALGVVWHSALWLCRCLLPCLVRRRGEGALGGHAGQASSPADAVAAGRRTAAHLAALSRTMRFMAGAERAVSSCTAQARIVDRIRGPLDELATELCATAGSLARVAVPPAVPPCASCCSFRAPPLVRSALCLDACSRRTSPPVSPDQLNIHALSLRALTAALNRRFTAARNRVLFGHAPSSSSSSSSEGATSETFMGTWTAVDALPTSAAVFAVSSLADTCIAACGEAISALTASRRPRNQTGAAGTTSNGRGRSCTRFPEGAAQGAACVWSDPSGCANSPAPLSYASRSAEAAACRESSSATMLRAAASAAAASAAVSACGGSGGAAFGNGNGDSGASPAPLRPAISFYAKGFAAAHDGDATEGLPEPPTGPWFPRSGESASTFDSRVDLPTPRNEAQQDLTRPAADAAGRMRSGSVQRAGSNGSWSNRGAPRGGCLSAWLSHAVLVLWWVWIALACGHTPVACGGPLLRKRTRRGTCCNGLCARTAVWPRSRRAFKVAISMALATLLAFTPALEGSGAQGSGAERLEWSVWTPITVSFVFMSASGQSVRQAMLRVGGTVAGSVYALLLVIAAKGDVLAIAVGLTLWASLLAPFRASQRNSYAGAVAAFTAAIVAVADREEGGSISDVAVSRMLQNCVGAAIFLGVTHIVWPHHGSVGSLKAVSETMGEAGEALRLALAKLAADMPDQAERDSLGELSWPRPDAASTQATATVAMLTTQVEAFAQDLPTRLADARIEMGLSASQVSGLRALIGADRQLRKLVRSARCIDLCRTALEAASSRAGRSSRFGPSFPGIREPLVAVARQVGRVTALSRDALRTLAVNDGARRDALCGTCRERGHAASKLELLDAAVPQVHEAIRSLDWALQHAADSGLDASSRAFRLAASNDPLSLAMNTAAFAARQAAEAALALAATVELVAAHLMPLDNMPEWVRLERDRKLL